ncbi:MAG: pilus assembly protein PilP [Alcanivoracaceae bacterium]|nr:pilus assembly protein PilP [Alcanivoracaceae bacterium]
MSSFSKRKIAKGFVVALVIPFAMSGCSSNGDFADLQAKMAEIKARPRGRIEPPPEFNPIASVSYAAHQMRSPFSPPVDVQDVDIPSGRQVEPDFTRPKEYLERFTLDSLKMKGSIAKEKGPLFALVQDPAGATNRVKTGDYMGKNFGRVIDVNESAVTVMEIVPDGQDGWVERPRTIRLTE